MKWLRIIPALQALSAFILLLAGVYIVRTRGNAERERVWAGMARESAHQLGTPLSSLAGWIELLEDRAPDEGTLKARRRYMRADLERLDRVAHRFERIGREPRRESVDAARARRPDRRATSGPACPTLAHAVRDRRGRASGRRSMSHGDAVLLEWALEVLVEERHRRARRTRRHDRASARRRAPRAAPASASPTTDPGIPRDLRGRIFEPGFSTKTSGWGIGLSLARRIVEENHGGTLQLAAADRGATFEIILP